VTTALDLDDLRTHIGRTQIATDVIHAGPANFLRLALGPDHRNDHSEIDSRLPVQT